MRALVHSLFHDQAPRHRTRPGHRAIGRGRPRRHHCRVERARARHYVSHRPAAAASGDVRRGSARREHGARRELSAAEGNFVPAKAHLLLVDDDPNTLASLEDLKTAGVKVPVIMMSGQANVEMAVRATRLGALDFLEKPLSTDKLLVTVENALRLSRLERENRELRQRLGKHEIVWTGPAMQRVMAQVERVAAGETRVCILGETGTGKELVARAIHEKSARREGPFITLNCAAVPAELIESELFGHEKGAFTGAAARHIGKFEQAHGGTLFLDEIGDMPLAMQAKLLRVLEEGEVERVGGDKPVA